MPVLDPGEQRLPDVGLILLKMRRLANKWKSPLRVPRFGSAFASEEERRRKALDKLFGSQGIDVVPLATNEDYLVALRTFFERRERRLAA